MKLATLVFAFVLIAPALQAQPTAPRARIVEDLRLDATKEDFTVFRRLYVGPRGQIVVPLAQDMQLRVYDSTGKPIGRVGRKGSGPGEFRVLQSIGWVADTLWVYDGTQERLTFFAPDLRMLRSIALGDQQVPVPSGYPSGSPQLNLFQPAAVYGDGSMLAEGRVAPVARTKEAQYDERIVVRAAPAAPTRFVAKSPVYEDKRWYVSAGGFGMQVPFALWPITSYAFDGSRLAHLWADADTPTGGHLFVSALNSRGDTLFARSYPYVGERISKASADSAVATMVLRGEGSPEISQQLQTLMRAHMPSTYVPTESLVIGRDNTLWIGMRATAEGPSALVLNLRGDPVATVLLPPKTTVRQASATRIWTTQTDADGLVSVVRYKVSGINCGAVSCK